MKGLVFNITISYIVLFFLTLMVPVIAFRHLLFSGLLLGFLNFCLLPMVIKLGLPKDYLSQMLVGAALNILVLTISLGLISSFNSEILLAAGIGGFVLSIITPRLGPMH